VSVRAAGAPATFVSANAGKTWRRRDTTLGPRLVWAKPDARYLGGKDGKVERSLDGGGTWTEARRALRPPRAPPRRATRGAARGRRLPMLGSMAFERDGIGHEEIRPGHAGLIAVGTLACPHCDAPVAPGERPLAVRDPLACPFCAHGGTVRDFLSLTAPARPARVEVRLRIR